MEKETKVVEGFLQTKIELGHIWSGKKITAKFHHREITSIVKTQASCDCVHIINETKHNRLLIEYKPNFPPQLKERGDKQYNTQKSITVTYQTASRPKQNQVVVLFITATVMLSV
jgi:hypothetical protein